VISDKIETISNLLLFVHVFGVLSTSYTTKTNANRNPPLPSFQVKVNEAGYEMNAKMIGAVNKIKIRNLESTSKEPTYMAMADSDMAFNHFP
jgi:hypothetical protein